MTTQDRRNNKDSDRESTDKTFDKTIGTDQLARKLPDEAEIVACHEDEQLVILFEPTYVKKQIDSHLKDRAKDKGLLIWVDSAGGKIALTDDAEEYVDLLSVFGLEDYLFKRVRGVI